ncbi:Y-family DNA polymerase [Levilactobacillus bambusae]|uniref:Excinuclease ABC subunit A n=1 Tax=Levilactobacillus bambusae TaxID=2024736 RepID=A0A2V1MZT6_9LACO|nr:Y-family DNA polymerase [Levilactobacillus bambusae]PWG00332.1 excinuclease ABC subunit A [Levilactobacillus bambusae]
MDYSNEPHGVYFFIDNKSFYASCESVARRIDPLESILVVMSEQENTNGGLILAASPMAKQLFHITNVSRQRDLPDDERLIVVPPRMNLYIRKNLEINAIYNRYVAKADLLPYSIDESLLDVTKSWFLFGHDLLEVAQQIQQQIYQELGLYTTVGVGENPVQAKLALDLYAKHDPNRIGQIKYDTVAERLWPVTQLTDVWSIGRRTAKRLNQLHIDSMADLARANPYDLKAEFGVMGFQLFALAWGVDRSQLTEPLKIRDVSFSNSQVLARDYNRLEEIEVVIREIGEQVASRVRAHGKLAGEIGLSIGFAHPAITQTGTPGFSHRMRLEPTNDNREVARQLRFLFEKYWEGQAVRNIAVQLGRLSPDNHQQLDLFHPVDQQIQTNTINRTLDQIRRRYGSSAIVKASSLRTGATAIQRASLVGGHNGGNAYD